MSTFTDEEIYHVAGVRKRRVRGAEVLDCGWSPSLDPTYGGTVVPHQASENVPEIDGEKIFLWDLIASAVGAAKMVLAFNWQLSGSCVNGGAQNGLIVRAGIDIAVHREPEAFDYPFTLAAYGESRAMMGMTTEGEGSGGDYMARCLRDFGATRASNPAIPERPHFCGPAFVYDRTVELKYSSIRNSRALQGVCQPHTIEFGNVTNADEAERELLRMRPLTWCGNWGGLTTVPEQDGVLLNRHNGVWNHQESCLGRWLHPRLGRLFWIQNQWFMPGSDMRVEYVNTRDGRAIQRIIKAGTAISVHGNPRNGEPAGGYWIRDVDMNYQCRTGEVRSIRKFKGYKDGTVHIGG